MTAEAAKAVAAAPKSAPGISLKTETEAITAHQIAPNPSRVIPYPEIRVVRGVQLEKEGCRASFNQVTICVLAALALVIAGAWIASGRFALFAVVAA